MALYQSNQAMNIDLGQTIQAHMRLAQRRQRCVGYGQYFQHSSTCVFSNYVVILNSANNSENTPTKHREQNLALNRKYHLFQRMFVMMSHLLAGISQPRQIRQGNFSMPQ